MMKRDWMGRRTSVVEISLSGLTGRTDISEPGDDLERNPLSLVLQEPATSSGLPGIPDALPTFELIRPRVMLTSQSTLPFLILINVKDLPGPAIWHIHSVLHLAPPTLRIGAIEPATLEDESLVKLVRRIPQNELVVLPRRLTMAL